MSVPAAEVSVLVVPLVLVALVSIVLVLLSLALIALIALELLALVLANRFSLLTGGLKSITPGMLSSSSSSAPAGTPNGSKLVRRSTSKVPASTVPFALAEREHT